jgi:hypothetical protein
VAVPTESLVMVIVVIGVFAIFSAALLWAEARTRHLGK